MAATVQLGTCKPLTTYQADFVEKEIRPNVEFYDRTRVRIQDSVSKEKPIKQPAQYDLDTMATYRRSIYVPFDLLFRPKDVVRTNPHEEINEIKMEEKIFDEKVKMRKIRPRVYLEPQIAIDNIDVDIMYGKKGKNGLADYIYSSDWKDFTNFAIKNSHLKKSTNADTEKLNNNGSELKMNKKILLAKSMESTRFKGGNGIPPMEMRLQKFSKDWEKMQKTEFIDKNKIFWNKNRDKGLCTLCDPQPENKTVTNEEAKEIDECLKDNALSLSYTVLNPAYTGYIPKLPIGVGYRKRLFKIGDPFVTTSMEAQGVYQK